MAILNIRLFVGHPLTENGPKHMDDPAEQLRLAIISTPLEIIHQFRLVFNVKLFTTLPFYATIAADVCPNS